MFRCQSVRLKRKCVKHMNPFTTDQGDLVVDRDVRSARHSRWDDDKTWSSQEWKFDEVMEDRTGRPD